MQFAWIEPPSPKALVSGQSYLVERARDNPAAFMTLLGKVLPTTLQGVNSDDLRVGYIVVPAKEKSGKIPWSEFPGFRLCQHNEALSIDPKHKGAHEYLGEAYLMVGNTEKAKEHLAQLDKICFFGCSEFSELKTAISDFETKKVAR